MSTLLFRNLKVLALLLAGVMAAGCAGGPGGGLRDLTQASVAELERLAAREDIEAIKELSVRYGTGNGVEQDGAKSIALLQRAVDKNDAGAMFMMGAAYANGIGVPVDEAQAVLWYEKAAERGNAFGQYWLAMMIGNSRGNISGNWAGAAPLLEKAARQGHSDAAFMLGWIYQTGEGGKIDYEEAAKWYRKASEKVLNQKAQFNLLGMIEQGQVEWRKGDPGQPRSQPAEGPPPPLKSGRETG